jgi:oligopeptide/dipeptide ABC transporter ATP-binding protein
MDKLLSKVMKQVLYKPLHPYTRALIAAIPKFTKDQAHHEIKIKNDPESISNQVGCKFINKCLYSTEKCKNSEPLLTTEEEETHSPSSSSSSPSSTPHDPHNSHLIRCFNYESIS